MFVDFNQKLVNKARYLAYKATRAAKSARDDQLWQPSAGKRVHKAAPINYDDEAVIAALKTDPKVDDAWAREELEPKLEPKRKSAKRAKHTHIGVEGDDDPVITGTRTLEERNAELLQHAVDLTQDDDDDE